MIKCIRTILELWRRCWYLSEISTYRKMLIFLINVNSFQSNINLLLYISTYARPGHKVNVSSSTNSVQKEKAHKNFTQVISNMEPKPQSYFHLAKAASEGFCNWGWVATQAITDPWRQFRSYDWKGVKFWITRKPKWLNWGSN